MRSIVLLALLSFAAPAFAQDAEDAPDTAADDEARMHYRLGRAYYDSGRFEEAAREFDEAYRLSNRPQLLYNIFVARRDAAQIPGAIEALRQYLELVPDAPDRDQLRARLESLERLHGTTAPEETEEELEPEETVTPPPEESEPAVTPAPVVTRPESAFPVVPVAVMAGGGALIVASLITGALAVGKESDLEALCPMNRCPAGSDFASMADSGQTLATVTDVLFVSGLLAVGTGVALLFVLDEDERDETSVSAGCTGEGCYGAVRGTF